MRKVIHADTYCGHPLNTTPKNHQGFYAEILNSAKLIIDYMISRHSQVLFTTITLKYPTGYADAYPKNNYQISMFMEAFTLFYSRKGFEMKYLWVRELSTTRQVHYHVMLLFNGNKIQNAYGVWCRASELWNGYFGSSGGLVHRSDFDGIDNAGGGVKIRRKEPDFNNTYAQVFQRASYLAKCYSKGNDLPHVKCFSSSTLP